MSLTHFFTGLSLSISSIIQDWYDNTILHHKKPMCVSRIQTIERFPTSNKQIVGITHDLALYKYRTLYKNPVETV